MGAYIGFKKYTMRRRSGECPIETCFQFRPITDSLADAWIIVTFGSQHDVMLGESPLTCEMLDSGPVLGKPVRKIGRTTGLTDNLKAARVFDPDQKFAIPGNHPDHRISTERAFTGDTERQIGKLHAEARLLACGLDLRASARNIASEGTKEIGVEPGHMFNPAAERCIEYRCDETLLAVLGKQGHGLIAIGMVSGYGALRLRLIVSIL